MSLGLQVKLLDLRWNGGNVRLIVQIGFALNGIFLLDLTEVLLDDIAIDEGQTELRRRAQVEDGNPHHRTLGETGADEGDQRRDQRLLAADDGEEERHGVRRPTQEESADGDDDA